MSARFLYTPRGESTAYALNVDWGGIERFQADFVEDKKVTVSTGGTVVTILRDAFFRYKFQSNPLNKLSDFDNWQRVSSFVSHAKAGGKFAFLENPIKNLDTFLSSGIAKDDTDMTLDSTTLLVVNDFIWIEDVEDLTRWEIRKVTQVSGPTQISEAVSYGFPAGSLVRHWEHFPLCIAEDVTWVERTAGQGSNRWDFAVQFRTVRG